MTEAQKILSEELYSITQGLVFSVDDWLLGELLSKFNFATHHTVSTCSNLYCLCVQCCNCLQLAGEMQKNIQHWRQFYHINPFYKQNWQQARYAIFKKCVLVMCVHVC